MEQQAVWEVVSNPYNKNGLQVQAMGPTPQRNNDEYEPFMTELPTLRCPSDPGVGLPSMGRTNYGACLGDSIWKSEYGPYNHSLYSIPSGPAATTDNTGSSAQDARASCRGAFVMRQTMKFRDILDGLANTIVAGELITDLGDSDARSNPRGPAANGSGLGISNNPQGCESNKDPGRPQFWSVGTYSVSAEARGFQWASAYPCYTGVFTILPPNREICFRANRAHTVGNAPPSSRHQGGCHVLMGDGAVKFVTDSIEAGDSNAAGVRINNAVNPPGSQSPYGLWGSLGTRASKETIEEQI